MRSDVIARKRTQSSFSYKIELRTSMDGGEHHGHANTTRMNAGEAQAQKLSRSRHVQVHVLALTLPTSAQPRVKLQRRGAWRD